MEFATEQDAARALLAETAQILDACGVSYAVVGGWRPYLFNSSPIPHPGTFDVDILVDDRTTKSVFETASTEFLKRGFLRAPKNKFQAHRILIVGGEPLVFHVDFLHRKYAPDADDMVMEWGKFQSIAGPGTDVVFVHNECQFERLSLVLPSGEPVRLAIPFATEVGLLATKGRSASVPKRTRDAFDIFLVVAQSNDRAKLVERCRVLRQRDVVFRLSLDEIVKGFQRGGWAANAAIHLKMADPAHPEPEATIELAMSQFCSEVEVPISLPE